MTESSTGERAKHAAKFLELITQRDQPELDAIAAVRASFTYKKRESPPPSAPQPLFPRVSEADALEHGEHNKAVVTSTANRTR